MNKYIRTGKNKTWEYIYKVLGQEELYWIVKDNSMPGGKGLVPKCIVIKKANTIKELCDEFVRVNHYTISEPYLIKPLPRDWEALGENSYEIALQEEINDQIEMKIRGDDFDLYGAIWKQEKGLIYVAKLNNKGVFELL